MDKEKIRYWQERLARDEAEYAPELEKMERRENVYRGSKVLETLVKGDRKKRASHVRNLTAELIEAQVNSSIPQPKVTAKRQEDEGKAKLIEDMLRNELERLPMEQLNDMMERTVPIQGGALYLVEWDHHRRTHTTVGELVITGLHPKQVIPQAGVISGVEEMDHIILKLPQTVESLRRRYGVNVRETEPEGEEDAVTQYVVYFRNPEGGIGRYSWAGDTQLENFPDYQAKYLKQCTRCGAPEPQEEKGERKACPSCGGTKWEEREVDTEEIFIPVTLSDGQVIPPRHLSGLQAGGVSGDSSKERVGLRQVPGGIRCGQNRGPAEHGKPH